MRKAIKFTDDELRTLVWAVNNQYNNRIKQNLEGGRTAQDDTTERLLEISRKAYGELTERLSAPTKSSGPSLTMK